MKEHETIDLSKFEKITREEKLKLIDKLKPEFEYLATYKTWREEVSDDFHFIDLDNDNDLDLVFTGWSGAEPVCVRIYDNKNDMYEKVFDAYQEVKQIEFAANKLSKISIYDPGCCASYIEFNEDYSVIANKDDFNFNLTNRTALLYPTEEPEDKFNKPIKFQVSNDKYYLRLTPKMDTVDQVFADDMQPDNIIAEFKKGTKGLAYGQKTDDTGRVWWFVEIDPTYKPVKSLFYDIDEKPTKLKGWMSSNYLRKF